MNNKCSPLRKRVGFCIHFSTENHSGERYFIKTGRSRVGHEKYAAVMAKIRANSNLQHENIFFFKFLTVGTFIRAVTGGPRYKIFQVSVIVHFSLFNTVLCWNMTQFSFWQTPFNLARATFTLRSVAEVPMGTVQPNLGILLMGQ